MSNKYNVLFTCLALTLLLLTQGVWATNNPNTTTMSGPSATTINYQGRLAAADGTPQNGTFGMSFAINDAASGGGIVWGPENHSAIPVTDGLFNVGLGSLTSGGIPTNVWGGDRYLKITVGGETLSPRELIRSVPIAGMALTVPVGAIGTEQIQQGAVTQQHAPNLIYSPAANRQLVLLNRVVTTDSSGAAVSNIENQGFSSVNAAVVSNGHYAACPACILGVNSISESQITIRLARPDGSAYPNKNVRVMLAIQGTN